VPEEADCSGWLTSIAGTFFREVDDSHAQAALAGSYLAGRYSRAGQSTLYLSASEEGVAVAMEAHRRSAEHRAVLRFNVIGDRIFDLRQPAALRAVRAAAGDPMCDWQACLKAGVPPASWAARDWIEARGAVGLIDPSRRQPGLWHLVLFGWNTPTTPQIEAAGSSSIR